MSKNKKKKTNKNASDPRLAAGFPTANSPEFVPMFDPDLIEPGMNGIEEPFDIIPDIKGDRFS
jgi:hypothetical protein